MKKRLVVLLIFVQLFTLFSSCTINVNKAEKKETGSGVITGKALYSNLNKTDNAGIIVTLEKTDGIRASAVAGTSTTAADGSYTFENLAEGTYTIYAASNYSKEKAVCTNIQVRSAQTTVAQTLNLTATGAIKGRVSLNGKNDDNLGILVFLAGTSYMAVTDNLGNYTISDIPAGNGYNLIAKGYDSDGNDVLREIDNNISITANDTLQIEDSGIFVSKELNPSEKTVEDVVITLNVKNYEKISEFTCIYKEDINESNSLENYDIENNGNGIFTIVSSKNGYYQVNFVVSGILYKIKTYINNIDRTPPKGNDPILFYDENQKYIECYWYIPDDYDFSYTSFTYAKDGNIIVSDIMPSYEYGYTIRNVEKDNSLYEFWISYVDDLGNKDNHYTRIYAKEQCEAGDVVLDDGSVVHCNGREYPDITQEQIERAVGILIPVDDYNQSFVILGLDYNSHITFEEAKTNANNYNRNHNLDSSIFGDWSLPTIYILTRIDSLNSRFYNCNYIEELFSLFHKELNIHNQYNRWWSCEPEPDSLIFYTAYVFGSYGEELIYSRYDSRNYSFYVNEFN